MQRLDEVLLQTCPLVAVPRFSALDKLRACGHRYLAGTHGLYLELRREWLHALVAIAPSAIPLPYGTVRPSVAFAFGAQLSEMVDLFVSRAVAALPLEHAAWLSWEGTTRRLVFEPVDILEASAAHVRYRRPSPAKGRSLAVDIHSHGALPAFFSEEDDADALDDAKLEIVVGSLGQERYSVVCRLSMLGVHLDYSDWLKATLYAEGIAISTEASHAPSA